jgi:predicted proteasome-type protease
MKLKNFTLEGDSLVVISALQNLSITQDWHIESIIANTMLLLSASSLWNARKVHRSTNFCAHNVAF